MRVEAARTSCAHLAARALLLVEQKECVRCAVLALTLRMSRDGLRRVSRLLHFACVDVLGDAQGT